MSGRPAKRITPPPPSSGRGGRGGGSSAAAASTAEVPAQTLPSSAPHSNYSAAATTSAYASYGNHGDLNQGGIPVPANNFANQIMRGYSSETE
eukprot:scaffold10033_cov116-Skeletonema_dohrnii-CCMP3373.AAC.3